jgi:flagellar motor component MotA
MEMRGHDGQAFKTTMQAYRHLEKAADINLTDQKKFKKSTQAFKAMTKELKRVGLAAIEHHSPIEDSDLEKMYDYFCQNLEDAH